MFSKRSENISYKSRSSLARLNRFKDLDVGQNQNTKCCGQEERHCDYETTYS